MRTKILILTAALACAASMSACATRVLPSALPTPPRREMPETAKAPCALPRLPDLSTYADLEAAYYARGAVIVACDAARQLAVDLHAAEHRDEDAWLREINIRRHDR